jgi:hypothetical protein
MICPSCGEEVAKLHGLGIDPTTGRCIICLVEAADTLDKVKNLVNQLDQEMDLRRQPIHGLLKRIKRCWGE